MGEGAHLVVRVTVRRGGASIVLDGDFAPGFTAVVGPSGVGKSTLVAAIAGVIPAHEGRIALGDEVWFDAGRGLSVPAHLRRAGVVFQGLALLPHLSVAENVGYGVPASLGGEERARRVRRALAMTRAEHLAARRPRTLSGGEAQRVAIARALAIEPRVLLLDEPLTALDDALRADLLETLRGCVAERPLPALYVTHRVDEAEALGARVVSLSR